MVDNLMNESPTENMQLDPELTPLEKKQVRKKLFILGIVVLLILAGLITATVKFYKPPVVVEGCSEGDSFSQTSGLPCKSEVKVTPCQEGEVYNRTTGEPCVGVEDKTAVPGTGSPTYESALVAYKGKSILFDANCAATPFNLTASVGSDIIIANHSQKTLELSIQNKKANLRPYFYMINSVKESGLFPVTCNGAVSASVIAK